MQAEVVSRGCGKREREKKGAGGFEVSSQDYRDIGHQVEMLIIQVHDCTKCHKITCFKMVSFKFYELCSVTGWGAPKGHVKLLIPPCHL